VIPSPEIINYKEALIFAFLGVLKIRGEINCLSSVTGASKDSSNGIIFS
jgi:anhydro-N-acetylmuramic acid kinase